MKRLLLLCLIFALTLSPLSGCSTPDLQDTGTGTRLFADDSGRTVTVPADPQRIAVTGPMAQIVLFALCPDRLVGLAGEWDAGAEQYIDEAYLDLPVLGHLYGTKGDLNPEALMATGAQLVIDVGEPKDTVAADLDALTRQTGLPFVHISATTDTMGDAYRMLGDLLGLEPEAEVLADYCETVYTQTKKLAETVEKSRVLYCLGEAGLNVIARGAYHGEVLDLLTDNAAVLEEPSSKGTGNQVDLEQLLLWDPEIILFAPDSVYASVGGDPLWQGLSAIRSGQYYEVPRGVHNWMGFPPSVQRYLGMQWLSALLYPDAYTGDLQAAVTEFFDLFYHCDLSQEQYQALVANSIGRKNAS